MVKIALACCLVLSLLSPASAIESDFYPYVGATAGASLTVSKLSDSGGSLDTDFKSGYVAGLTAGVAFNTYYGWNVERIRVEAEVGYRSSDLLRMKNSQGQIANVNGTITVKNYMINTYFDNTNFKIIDIPVTIFLTAGAGVATASISNVVYQGIIVINSVDDTQLAYQGGLGIGYELTNKISVGATYKYMGTAPFKVEGIKADYASHNVLFGALYAFK